MLVGGGVVSKYNQLGEVEAGGGRMRRRVLLFFHSYSTASGESELKWRLAVGEKCDTMIDVKETPWT